MKNKYTYLKTLDDLEKHLGKIIVLYYYKDYFLENNIECFDPDNKKRELSFMWMTRLETYIKYNYNHNNSIRNNGIGGKILISLYSTQEIKPMELLYTDTDKMHISESHSYVRLATPQEIKIYRNFARKDRFKKLLNGLQ